MAILVPVVETTFPVLSFTSAGQLIAIVLSLAEKIAIFCCAVFPPENGVRLRRALGLVEGDDLFVRVGPARVSQ